MRVHASHIISQLVLLSEQSTQLRQLTELTRHIATQQTLEKLNTANAPNKAREQRALLGVRVFFLTDPWFCTASWSYRDRHGETPC